uniref:Uncharacterized protein n=1 Tax=Rhizophora mucronata TaxID=61149 RepID=A0A2P2QI76_RHIMU
MLCQLGGADLSVGRLSPTLLLIHYFNFRICF